MTVVVFVDVKPSAVLTIFSKIKSDIYVTKSYFSDHEIAEAKKQEKSSQAMVCTWTLACGTTAVPATASCNCFVYLLRMVITLQSTLGSSSKALPIASCSCFGCFLKQMLRSSYLKQFAVVIAILSSCTKHVYCADTTVRTLNRSCQCSHPNSLRCCWH